MALYKKTGRMPGQLAEQPDLPEELDYILRWFYELRSHEPIKYAELASWSSLQPAKPQHWEIEVIKALDGIYWSSIND